MHKKYLISGPNQRSTEDVLNWSLSCFVTAAKRLLHCKIPSSQFSLQFHSTIVLLLSQVYVSLRAIDVAPHTQVPTR